MSIDICLYPLCTYTGQKPHPSDIAKNCLAESIHNAQGSIRRKCLMHTLQDSLPLILLLHTVEELCMLLLLKSSSVNGWI